MKRILSLLLTALLLLCPCMALAEGGVTGGLLGGALGGASSSTEVPAEEAPVTLYTMESCGISIELPEEWLVMTSDLGVESPMATLYGFTQEEVDAVLTSIGGASLYAMTDLLATGQLFVLTVDGMPLVDMRIGKSAIDLDAFMEGFLQGFTQSIPEESVLECGSFATDTTYFARIIFLTAVEGGNTLSVQYCTNVNNKIYIIQYVTSYTSEPDEATIQQLDTAVRSLTFLEDIAQ